VNVDANIGCECECGCECGRERLTRNLFKRQLATNKFQEYCNHSMAHTDGYKYLVDKWRQRSL